MELNENDYNPEGDNALYDAVGTGIKMLEKDKKISERAIVIILTDGKVNESEKISNQDLKEIVSTKNESEDWKILYIGGNLEQWFKDSGCYRTDAITFNYGDCDRNFEIANDLLSYFRKAKSLF
jgi:hypothetical protein